MKGEINIKKYYCESNAYNVVIFTDDENKAIYFDVETKEEAENLDISGIVGLHTAEEMAFACCMDDDKIFTFNEDEWEYVEELPIYWYAVMKDTEDNDWGFGSFNLKEAKEMVKQYIKDGGYIAVIDEGADPVCIDEIRF